MRKYLSYKEPIPYTLIKDFFTEEEISLMLRELQFLTPKMRFIPPRDLEDNAKRNHQITLDEIYTHRSYSDILTIIDTVYQDIELIKRLIDSSWFYNIWEYTNRDTTCASHWVDDDYYKQHRDIAVISIMYWLWEEPKQFTGGDIRLTDYNINIPIEKNMMMIMPSSTRHEISTVTGKGRHCIVRFLYLEGKQPQQ